MAIDKKLTTSEHHKRNGLSSLPSDGSEALIPLTRLYHPPSPHKVHPRADWVIEQVRQWLYPHLAQLGAEKLIKGIVNETASMCTYLYPNADDEGLFLATGFMTVQFINDDIFDSAAILKAIQATPSGQRLARDLRKLRDTPQRLADGIVSAARIMENPNAYEKCRESILDLETDPFLLGAIYELSARMRIRGRRINEERFEVWLAKSCTAMKDFGKSHALIYSEAKNMTVEEYADHKLRNSGMIYTVLFVEMAMGIFLSEEHNAIPQIRQMQQHSEKIGSLLNEIFSYEKETFLENTNNLLAVLVRTEKISLYEAARRVAEMSQRHAREVQRIRIEIEAEWDDDSGDGTGLGTYVVDMELFGAACWFWQLQGTKRYFSKTSPFAELRLAGLDSEAEVGE
ncbi:terpene synthase [Fusarium phyllophilum]|uniref:Terpene synthase n=1 Tax=Fusarium phyllophilum TaxID=47803 RepID=A0A8H5NF96_9HYPO|nr:terpene synthase [Fusarium phyllophilum]